MKKTKHDQDNKCLGEPKESSTPKMAWMGKKTTKKKKKKAQPYCEPEENLIPNYQEYLNKPAWTDYEAAALLAEVSPDEFKRRIGKMGQGKGVINTHPDDVDWVVGTHKILLKVHNEIKRNIGSNKLDAKLVHSNYFIKTHDFLNWADKHSKLMIPKELAKLALSSGLLNKSSKSQAKASPYGSIKTKLKYLKSDFISIAKEILTKNKDAKAGDVENNYSFKSKIDQYNLPKKKPSKKTYGSWMTKARQSFNPPIKGPLGKPKNKQL